MNTGLMIWLRYFSAEYEPLVKAGCDTDEIMRVICLDFLDQESTKSDPSCN